MSIYLNTDLVILEQIGQRIKSIRLKRNMTQDALASAVGISVKRDGGIRS